MMNPKHQPKIIALKPIRESTADYDLVEKRIKQLFRREVYLPLMREFEKIRDGKPVVMNAKTYDALREAIRVSQIQFYRSSFTGKFDSGISRELRALGAVWDRKTRAYKIPLSALPYEIRAAISGSETMFQQKMEAIDRKLAEILPEKISSQLKVADLFDRTLWKVDREFESSVKGLIIPPKLTPEGRARIAAEWENNLKLYIQKFTAEQIPELRANIKKAVFAGNRYETSVKTIQASYDTTASKAKFLARQETGLLMAKFKEVRYAEAGVHEYKWHSVVGSPLHPVRPRHAELAKASVKGTIFRWDQPPNTAEAGTPPRFNNPGQDYNCRCFAIPIVRF